MNTGKWELPYLCVYGLRGSRQEWAWSYKCVVSFAAPDIAPHIVLHRLKEAP